MMTKKFYVVIGCPFHDPMTGNQMQHLLASILAIRLHQGMSNMNPPSDGIQNGSPDSHYCNGVRISAARNRN